ncbi:MAG TPA: hypothetical protein VFY83_02730, partial [Anaerolineales bacterium]|nr:hypothetical protein [Anaerolineales bacterium]
MRYSHITLMSLIILVMIAVSACGTTAPATPGFVSDTRPAPTATEPPEVEEVPTQEPTEDPEFALLDIEMATFDNPTQIDNKYFPLTPGTEYVYDGFTQEGNNKIPHSIIYTVTDLTKEVAGIQTVVAY